MEQRAGTPKIDGGAVTAAPILAAEGAGEMRRIPLWMGLFVVLVSVPIAPAGPALAGGVRAVRVATELNTPVAFTFLPDGRLIYLEKNTGWLRFRNLQTDADHRIYRITNVRAESERGALGVDVHPDWPQEPFIYVFATRDTPNGLRNQVLRIRMEDDEPTGVRVVLSAAAGPASVHNGGRIQFGPGDKLFVVIGDNAEPSNAQDLSANLRGKILRINPDGSTPGTNPFGTPVWAYGIRNSIGFAFDPQTERLWEEENGPECNDELNKIVKGGNYGWGPNQDCPDTNNSGPTPRIRPRYTFADTKGLTGVAFCDSCGLGAGYGGDLFVGAWNDGVIRRFDLNARRTAFDSGPIQVLDRANGVISLEVGLNGRIYFSDAGAIYRLVPA
jgi:glucose/arabinose dehydrogenase